MQSVNGGGDQTMPDRRRGAIDRPLPRGKIVAPLACAVGLVILWSSDSLGEAFVPPRRGVRPRRSSRPRRSDGNVHVLNAAASSSPPNVDLPRVGPTQVGSQETGERPSDGASPPRERERFLVHRGKSADMIFRAPAISGITVCRNWTPEATQALKDATQELVRNNPILSGIVVRRGGNSIATGELWIEAGQYDPDHYSFVNVVPVTERVTHRDLSEHLSLSPTNALAYLLERVEPSFHHLATSTAVQAEQKLPLLDVSIMVVPENDDTINDDTTTTTEGDYAIFSLTVSHAVGDGVTFFQILRQLSVLVSGLDPSRHRIDGDEATFSQYLPDIDWSFRSQSKHEIYPVTYSRRDVDVAYGVPFLVGMVKSAILTLSKRKPVILLLDKDKVKMEKMKMRKRFDGTSSVSSNDVVSLALCEANANSDVFIFTENARDGASIPRNAGGNFFWEIPFDRLDAVRDPRAFRAVVESKQPAYATDLLPLQPFVCGRVGRLTSLATVVSEPIVYGSVETIGTFPVTSFLHGIPMDVALIFRYNKQYLGVLHNFVQLDCPSGSLLDSILVRES